MAEVRKCPDCPGEMSRIRLIDKGQHGSHGEFEYCVPNARPDFLTGQYPVTGTVAAFMCSQCGRVTLYGQVKEGAS